MTSDYPPDSEDDTWNPLQSGAAAPPPVRGGGCLARFDPDALNDESGADFAAKAEEDEA